jgi:hypothetical protein
MQLYENIKDWIKANQTNGKLFVDMISELGIKEQEEISNA